MSSSTAKRAASVLARLVPVVLVGLLLARSLLAVADQPPEAPDSGRRIYAAACAACHGSDGTGATRVTVGFDVELPDFTDCSFATREPDVDWAGVVHNGGPSRRFDPMMPAFGDALSDAQIQRTLDYVRAFCDKPGWPRGDLNLPRPLVTEKAFIEDELVLTTAVNTQEPGGVFSKLIYEQRFGAANQLEIILPFTVAEGEDATWDAGLGDIGLGVKRALLASRRTGTVVSLAGEVFLPTGDEDRGFGKGLVVLEPFLAAGQLLPANGFLHAMVGMEIPTDQDDANMEAFWRAALGMTFRQGRFGRAWSPMVEVLGVQEIHEGEEPQWDLVPQLQVSLSRRQHVLASIGARVPLTDTDVRKPQVMVYLLWDWFDGELWSAW